MENVDWKTIGNKTNISWHVWEFSKKKNISYEFEFFNFFFFKAAGGLSHDLTPTECMIKECGEEAQIPKEFITGKLKAVGAIRYISEFNT